MTVLFMGKPYPLDATRVYSNGVDVTLDELASLTRLPHLVALNLNTTKTTDAMLDVIGRLTRLEDLDLSLTEITNDGLPRLRALTQLRHLRIKENALDDDAIEHLLQFPLLETLNVKSLPLTDASLAVLAKLQRLELVVFSHVSFGEDALRRFHRALPKCEVIVDGLAHPPPEDG